MGMYTALEIHVKLRWDNDLVRILGKSLFDIQVDQPSYQIGLKPWSNEEWWCYLLHRMFWLDGGNSFGEAYRRLCVGEGGVMLDTCSSYKGITHWDFIEWVMPVVVSGFVRWNQEGIDRDDCHFFTRPDEMNMSGDFSGPKAVLKGRYGNQWHVLIKDNWSRVKEEVEKLDKLAGHPDWPPGS